MVFNFFPFNIIFVLQNSYLLLGPPSFVDNFLAADTEDLVIVI